MKDRAESVLVSTKLLERGERKKKKEKEVKEVKEAPLPYLILVY